jgi:hypothetical protein
LIPDIGTMIGLYIITRMVALLFNKDASIAPKIMSVITIIVALASIVDLLNKGSTAFPAHM